VTSHPAHYTRNVFVGSMSFWKGMGRGDFLWRDSSRIIAVIWTAEKLIMFIGMGIVFCAGLLLVVCRLRSVIRVPRGRTWASLAVVIVVSCVFQALTQFGANARYGVPFQPVWALCGVVFVHEAVRTWRSRGSTQESS
jgi:hypothetical protein